MAHINQHELLSKAAERVGLTKGDAELLYTAVREELLTALEAGETVVFTRLAKFERFERKPRVSRNPRSGEEINVPAKNVVRIRPLKDIKALTQEV